MLRHSDIWRALDKLASEQGLTPSGLARRAGLDPTTFNRSKRVTRDGKLRWPSTESVSKVLEVTKCSLGHLVTLIDEPAPGAQSRVLPLIDLAHAGADDAFDEAGRPSGAAWRTTALPDFGDPSTYAVRVTGDVLSPVYEDGVMLIVSPSAELHARDRVVGRLKSGPFLVRQVARRTARGVDLSSLGNGRDAASISAGDLAWVARIIWASQ
jgi:phage repressor protein C with HTH and peptisase S24 domain